MNDTHTLEALAVNDRRTALVVLLLGYSGQFYLGKVISQLTDPHLLEGRERCQNGTTDPDRVLALGWCDDLDLHGRWGEGGDFLLHTIGDTWVHGGTTRLDLLVRFQKQDAEHTMTMFP
jgi:hypothetical protein